MNMGNFNFNLRGLSSNNGISFVRAPDNQNTLALTFSFANNNNAKTLNLLDDSNHFNILEFMPRLFTITTNNSSGIFNIDLLKDTSSVINDFLKENPKALQYHIDVNDEGNVFGKFVQMYQGIKVVFDEDELPISKKITKALNILCCPNYMKPESLRTNELLSDNYLGLNAGVGINKNALNQYVKLEKFRTFTINTRKNKYLCNQFGVYASEVIRELLLKDPLINQYTYDFDDDSDEFQPICNFLNFDMVSISSNNMHLLKEIAEDLEIKFILPKIEKNINEYENVSKAIDEQQAIIDSTEEVFDWLYNMQEITIDSVKNSIVQSIWSKSEDNIHELAAFILQVVKASIPHHPLLISLLVQLNKEADESNDLILLVPFITKQLLFAFGESFQNCSFIYKLYQSGFISKEDINNNLKRCLASSNNPSQMCISSVGTCNMTLYYIYAWFLPELIENNSYNENQLFIISKNQNQNSKVLNIPNMQNMPNVVNVLIDQPKTFLNEYYPDKIDLYKKMRDSGEPDDELTIALRKDDIDKVQTILTTRGEDLSQTVVPYNIYENFINNGLTNLIDYAAAYGSLKCFKYFILNHLNVNENTFIYAVYGGNIEIIKIVNQQLSTLPPPIPTGLGSNPMVGWSNLVLSSSVNYFDINPSIMKHKNDLFDWILEQRYSGPSAIDNSSNRLLSAAAENGNAHAFIEVYDKNATINIQDFVQTAAKNGFYRLTKLIFDLMNKRSEEFKNQPNLGFFNTSNLCVRAEDIGNGSFVLFNSAYVSFGNLSIAKIGLKMNNNSQDDLEKWLAYCISREYLNIFKYFFDEVINDDFKITRSLVASAIPASFRCKSSYYFNFLIEQIKLRNPSIFYNFYEFAKLLENACRTNKIEYVKPILEIIIEYKIINNFTSAFVEAAISGSKDICQYLIDQKILINYNIFLGKINEIGSLKQEIFAIIYDNALPETKENLLSLSLNTAIRNKNKDLIEYLFSKNAFYSGALIDAVKTNDIDIVNIVLKHNSKPSFINIKDENGTTALYLATMFNNAQIVKRLLELPGIDPSLYEKSDQTPLILSINNFNIEIMNLILDFYGENISSQVWQIEEAIKTTLRMLSNIIPYNNLNLPPNNVVINSVSDISINQKSKLLDILKIILKIKGINPNIRGGDHTLLSYACEANEISIVQMLLNTDKVNINAYAPKSGNTPLMIAIQSNNAEIAELLINDKRTNINIRNYNDQTALTIATSNKMSNIIDILLNNENFDPEESCLNYAFFISTGEIAKKLISLKSIDVNYKYVKKEFNQIETNRPVKTNQININNINNMLNFDDSNNINNIDLRNYETPLTYAVTNEDNDKIDLIIQSSSFDLIKSQLKQSIFISARLQNIDIFKKLLKLIDDDINICNNNMQTILFYAVTCKLEKIIPIIFNYDTFDSNKSNILAAFNQACKISQLEIVEQIYQFDQKHDHLIDFAKLLPNGKSYSTSIFICENIDSLINFFLENGADPNIPDKNGVYPLQYAITSGNEIFVSSLIDSGKIDFSKKIINDPINDMIPTNVPFLKNLNSWTLSTGSGPLLPLTPKFENASYLHLAAISNNPNILKIFLDKNVIDINITDAQGETPLFYAIRVRNQDNIRSLFEQQNLDFLHCNNEGLDALKILNCNDEIKDKEQYLNCLLNQGIPFGLGSFKPPSIQNNSAENKGFSGFNLPGQIEEEEEDSNDALEKSNSEEVTFPAPTKPLESSVALKSGFSFGQNKGFPGFNLPSQTKPLDLNGASKSAFSFGQNKSNENKGFSGFNLPGQSKVDDSNGAAKSAFSFGQNKSTENKGFSGFNLPSQTKPLDSNGASKSAFSFGQNKSNENKGFSGFNLPSQSKVDDSNGASKPSFSFGQNDSTENKEISEFTVPIQTKPLGLNNALKSDLKLAKAFTTEFADTVKNSLKQFPEMMAETKELPDQSRTMESNEKPKPSFSFGQNDSTENKGLPGFNLPSQTKSLDSKEESKPSFSFGQNDSAENKELPGFNLPSESKTLDSNDGSKFTFSFKQKDSLAADKLNSKSNIQSQNESSNLSSSSMDQSKSANSNSLFTEKVQNNERKLSAKPINKTAIENSNTSNQSFEQEVESAISNILEGVSPSDMKLISKSLSEIAEKKVEKMMSGVKESSYDEYLDIDQDSPNDQSLINYQENYQDFMMQQQLQQLMQVNYVNQARFNAQMQKMQSMVYNQYNQLPKKKGKKSKNKSKSKK